MHMQQSMVHGKTCANLVMVVGSGTQESWRMWELVKHVNDIQTTLTDKSQ